MVQVEIQLLVYGVRKSQTPALLTYTRPQMNSIPTSSPLSPPPSPHMAWVRGIFIIWTLQMALPLAMFYLLSTINVTSTKPRVSQEIQLNSTVYALS